MRKLDAAAYEELERDLTFVALAGDSEEALARVFREALERYCARCRALSPRACAQRPAVLLDMGVWARPVDAAAGRPLQCSVADSATALARGVRNGRLDAAAILSALAREAAR